VTPISGPGIDLRSLPKLKRIQFLPPLPPIGQDPIQQFIVTLAVIGLDQVAQLVKDHVVNVRLRYFDQLDAVQVIFYGEFDLVLHVQIGGPIADLFVLNDLFRRMATSGIFDLSGPPLGLSSVTTTQDRSGLTRASALLVIFRLQNDACIKIKSRIISIRGMCDQYCLLGSEGHFMQDDQHWPSQPLL
jgi:hypothetical protein